MTYSNFALRRVPGARALPSLFVDVLQPTDDGALLVAQMSAATAHPGRWHLPGGSVEHPDAGTCPRTRRHCATTQHANFLKNWGSTPPPTS
ncbi:hypothetical protein [Streptomyces caniscabiei]|uniref:hypothetical protein n=1 Tax=Streptomyces caniscabiei TaxID=2746961 RepID=UPI0018727C13|nr:hypothetical protein [Streptomyces caniscabiei]MBE4771199.1 hypothetical protein [Streptomyces caniscabiei]MDX2952071.1 hypothetical protein [Streptomyces caniscabiei]